MKLKIILISTLFLMLILSVSAISADELTNNDTFVDENQTETFDTLQGEIYQSRTNLTLEKDYSFESEDADRCPEGIYIDKQNFVLDGNGHKIDAKGQSRIFYIVSENVTINNLTFLNGNSYFGGAIFAECNANGLRINNCRFEGNFAERGGGIYSYADDGEIQNCHFANNSAEIAGAAYLARPTNLIKTQFQSNNAKYCGALLYGANIEFNDYGKEIIMPYYFHGDNKSCLVEDCRFDNNSAENSGVGHFFFHGLIKNCNFTNNFAEKVGAMQVMSAYGLKVVIEGCNYINNSAKSCGSLYSDCNLLLNNTNFTGNYAEEMGAINLKVFDSISKCNFIANHVNASGGALLIRTYGSIKECLFENNSANDCGGAIYFDKNYYSEKIFIMDCVFKNNNANEGKSIYTLSDLISINNQFDQDNNDCNTISLKENSLLMEFEDLRAYEMYLWEEFLRENNLYN